MLTVQALHLGPFMIPWPILIGLLSLLLALWLSSQLRLKFNLAPLQWQQFKDSVWSALWIGLLCARLVFVAINYQFYLASPIDIIKIQDKGFNPIAGVVAAMAWLFWKNRKVHLGFIAIFIITVATVMGTGQLLLQKVQQQYQQYPQVTLTDLQQNPIQLQQFKGKATVINLWASWCPPCHREMPVLAAAQQRETDIQFVLINQGEDATQVQNYLSENQLVMHNVLLDSQGQTAQATGMYGLPSTLFYNANGELVDSHMGEISHAVLAQKLQQLK